MPAGTIRFTQVVPQQRCSELQVGEQSPLTVESVVPPSPPATHTPDMQSWPGSQTFPHIPQCWVLLWVAWQNAAPLAVGQHMSPAAHAGEHAAPRPSSPHDASATPITTRKAAPARRKMKAIFDINELPAKTARTRERTSEHR